MRSGNGAATGRNGPPRSEPILQESLAGGGPIGRLVPRRGETLNCAVVYVCTYAAACAILSRRRHDCTAAQLRLLAAPSSSAGA